jgi:hypothetical protein
MPIGAHIFKPLEDALAECFHYHTDLDTFLLRSGLQETRLKAARQRAERRKGSWYVAPKRFVVQEVLEELRTGTASDDRLIADLITALCRGDFSNANETGRKAIEKLKSQRAEDSRMAAEHREQNQREQEEAKCRTLNAAGEAKAARRFKFKEQFLSLHSLTDSAQARGYALETLLNEFMEFEDLSPRGSFKLVGEQIDGSFSWNGNTFLVEAKWTTALIDGSSFGAFGWKIDGKTANTRGLFIAINGYSQPAIRALNSKGALKFVCIDGTHLLHAIEHGLPKLLTIVWRHADETGEAYLPVSSPQFLERSAL